MAKQGKVLPARKPREEESLLLRSAESLGRMIGSLQRQLDDASRKLPRGFMMPPLAGADGQSKRATSSVTNPRTSANARSQKSASKSGATKVRSTADRKSKRASKSAAAKKSAGRGRSGAAVRARKASRHA
jgi:hypothetical protein